MPFLDRLAIEWLADLKPGQARRQKLNGLELALFRLESYWRLLLARKGARPSERDIVFCRIAFEVWDTAEGVWLKDVYAVQWPLQRPAGAIYQQLLPTSSLLVAVGQYVARGELEAARNIIRSHTLLHWQDTPYAFLLDADPGRSAPPSGVTAEKD